MSGKDKIVIRRLKSQDRKQILEVIKDIWEGHDYLPFVYASWVRDKKGAFLGAELNGKIVGCVKLTMLGPHECWLEGIRVNPAVQGHGVGLALQDAIIKAALKKKPISIRYATGIINKASMALGTKGQFKPVTKPWVFNKEIKPTKTIRNIERITDPIQAGEMIFHDPDYFEMYGLVANGWTLYTLTKERLAHYCKQGWVFGHVDNHKQLKGVGILMPHHRWDDLTIGLVVGDSAPIIEYAIQHASDYGRNFLMGATAYEKTRQIYKDLGFNYKWKHHDDEIERQMVIMEYQGDEMVALE